MTLPPPPSGNPGPPPQFGGGDPFGPPQGGPAGYPGAPGGPPQHHAPQWQPPHQPPPAWAPNPGAPPPGPPKKRGNGWKWGLGGVALLAVIGVTAAVSISVVKGKDGGSNHAKPGTPGTSQSPTGANADIASANDTGPATIITEDPTCAAWEPINNAVSATEAKTGWADHDYKVPASDWTPELRETYETMSKAVGTAADQAVALAKRTPHRVMRELYEQFIAYTRQFVGSLSNYTAIDIHLANAAASFRATILYVCQAIDYKSAAARAPLVSDPAPPSNLAKSADVSNPQRFMTAPDEDCAKWQSLNEALNTDLKEWRELNPNIPADNWNSDQHAIIDGSVPIMKKYADDVEGLGRGSSNPTIEDFGVLAAQYWRAYVAALSSYTSADYYLAQAPRRLSTGVSQACLALGA